VLAFSSKDDAPGLQDGLRRLGQLDCGASHSIVLSLFGLMGQFTCQVIDRKSGQASRAKRLSASSVGLSTGKRVEGNGPLTQRSNEPPAVNGLIDFGDHQARPTVLFQEAFNLVACRIEWQGQVEDGLGNEFLKAGSVAGHLDAGGVDDHAGTAPQLL
jgi:hypothetical protein